MLTDKPTGQTPEGAEIMASSPQFLLAVWRGGSLPSPHGVMDISTWISMESDIHIVSKRVSEVIWHMAASRRSAAFAHSL